LLPGQVNEFDPTWSSDGKQLAFGSPVWGVESAKARPIAIYLVDLGTREGSKIPDSEGLLSPRWSPDGKHLAGVSSDSERLVLFDFATRKWSELVGGGVSFPRWSRDSKYIYWDGLGEDAFVSRVRIADHVVEHVASLKDMRKTGAMGSWAGSAPDGSPLILRYSNSEEIYFRFARHTTRIALPSGHALHLHLPWSSPNMTTLLSRGNSCVRSSIGPSLALLQRYWSMR
jgi:WD40 repeat protein